MQPPPKELPRSRLIYTIRVRLFIIISLLLLLNVCGGVVHLLLEQQQNKVEMATNMIEKASDTLLSAMIDQETGLRGYITTADPVFLQPFYLGRKTYLTTFPRLTQVLIEANVETTQIHVCVRDQGIGIPDEALEAIFHPYNRVHAEDTRYIKETGLGLPIVRHLVELHGGRIWAESVQGQGSVFHFVLPIKKTAQLTH